MMNEGAGPGVWKPLLARICPFQQLGSSFLFCFQVQLYFFASIFVSFPGFRVFILGKILVISIIYVSFFSFSIQLLMKSRRLELFYLTLLVINY